MPGSPITSMLQTGAFGLIASLVGEGADTGQIVSTVQQHYPQYSSWQIVQASNLIGQGISAGQGLQDYLAGTIPAPPAVPELPGLSGCSFIVDVRIGVSGPGVPDLPPFFARLSITSGPVTPDAIEAASSGFLADMGRQYDFDPGAVVVGTEILAVYGCGAG